MTLQNLWLLQSLSNPGESECQSGNASDGKLQEEPDLGLLSLSWTDPRADGLEESCRGILNDRYYESWMTPGDFDDRGAGLIVDGCPEPEGVSFCPSHFEEELLERDRLVVVAVAELGLGIRIGRRSTGDRLRGRDVERAGLGFGKALLVVEVEMEDEADEDGGGTTKDGFGGRGLVGALRGAEGLAGLADDWLRLMTEGWMRDEEEEEEDDLLRLLMTSSCWVLDDNDNGMALVVVRSDDGMGGVCGAVVVVVVVWSLVKKKGKRWDTPTDTAAGESYHTDDGILHVRGEASWKWVPAGVSGVLTF
ncbi:hypothetical protein PPACK8108_LOCUS19964 [Phakopsora pachyrhizi]|uniref:Uncharacterized protein n=1 Tax=Phakopsora pachyrhizi TaxID=170000 RepID=A0AAV0BHL7_PHAPC|nr:hypothetical protein PPACK8108_LOCUS19964 [Phakopsora pachyrhizi]